MSSTYGQFTPGSAANQTEPAVSVSIQKLSKRYRSGHEALRSIDLEIAQGEFLTILGPSGCGKTTLLRILAGLEPTTSGRVMVDGVDIGDVPPNKRPMAMVFQNYALFPHLSVLDNVAYGLRASGVSKAEIVDRVGVVLSIMDLVGLEDRFPDQLSGGQQQRVALARSVVVRPKVLLLDEPLSSLDARLRDQMRSELRRIQRQLGVTSIYVTHDQSEAMVMSDRIVVMSEGSIEQVGTPEEIYRSPSSLFVASFVGSANVVRAPILGREDGLLRVEVFGVATLVSGPDSAGPDSADQDSADQDSAAPSFRGSKGTTATVVMRPEDFQVSSLENPNGHAASLSEGFIEVSGWLRSAEYLGASSHLGVELFEGSLISVVANHTASHGPDKLPIRGQGVLLRVPVSAIRAVTV